MKKYKEKQKVKGKRSLMLLILIISSLAYSLSCNHQDGKKNIFSNTNKLVKKDTILSYTIYKDTSDTECKLWHSEINSEINILKYIREFKEFDAYEWNMCFGHFPCGVKGVLVINNTNYKYNLNAGGWIELKNGDSIRYLGSTNQEDTLIFRSIYYCNEDWGQ